VKTLDSVLEVLRGPCGVTADITLASRLVEDLELDSVGLLCLAVGLENRFRVKLEENPEEPPDTVSDVVELLERAIGKGTL
jgi:acyl carrier protein